MNSRDETHAASEEKHAAASSEEKQVAASPEDARDARSSGHWLARWTTFESIAPSLVDEPSSGIVDWIRTTAGIVAMLLALQFLTGVLLAFYYAPSTESAHTTVAFIEKVLPAGSWLRALHHFGSQWLTLFLVLHIAQLFARASYRRGPVAWLASVLLLALALAAGATGYSLAWDARAFFSTRVAEGIASALPLVGATARRWLLGGAEISPLTLTRLFALHALVTPFLILLVIVARLFIFRERGAALKAEAQRMTDEQLRLTWTRAQFTRNAVAAGLVFLALAVYAVRAHAPLGPPASAAAPDYLPRPGAQFLWLFQLLRMLPGRIASVVAVALPLLIFIALAALPFLKHKARNNGLVHPRRRLSIAAFSLTLALISTLTAIAYINDRRNPSVREQLARQDADEAEFRAAPFTPQRLSTHEAETDERQTGPATANSSGSIAPLSSNTSTNAQPSPDASTAAGRAPLMPPDAYQVNCSLCHGTRGQGMPPFPRLTGVSMKPRRTVEDLIAIINDPASYGLKPPMKSYADKLTEDEKRAIAEWMASLKKK